MRQLSPEEKNAKMSSERAFLTKLLEAALHGDFEKLEAAVEDYCRQHDGVSKTDVLTQFRDGKRRTALHFACQSMPTKTPEGGCDVVEQMITTTWLPSSSLPKMIRMKDKDGLTPIMLAAQVKDGKLAERRVKVLVQVSKGVVADDPTSNSKLGLARSHAGATALHYAAGAGALSTTVKELYDAGQVAIQTSSSQGGTPLHWACGVPPPNDFTETIGALLDCGANLNAHEASSSQFIPTPLAMALAAGNDKHAKFLLQQAGEREIDMQPTIDYKLPGGVTVYHMAADMNMVGALSLLLERGVGEEVLNSRNDDGFSPLDLAAKEGHVGCVLLLLPGANQTEEDATQYIEEYKTKKQHTPPEKKQDEQVKPDMPAQSQRPDAIEAKSEEEAAKIASKSSSISDECKSKAQDLKAKGNQHFANKEYEEACKLYSEAIAEDPTDATFYSNRSACHVLLQRPEDALHDAVITRHLRPQWSKGAYRMAVARLELGRYEDAAVAAWEGLQQDQENEELKRLLQKCVKRGRKDFRQSQKNKKEEGT